MSKCGIGLFGGVPTGPPCRYLAARRAADIVLFQAHGRRIRARFRFPRDKTSHFLVSSDGKEGL
jgi:hypothetical protein